MVRWIAAGLLCASLPLNALAQSTSHREVASHVHGEAEIAIVQEGRRLTVELQSPLFNIVGFEHAPSSAAERAAIAKAKRLLTNGLLVAAPSPAAQCKPLSADADFPVGAHDSYATPKGSTHDHDKGHDAQNHDDLTATFVFDCSQLEQLKHIDITALKTFPGITSADTIFLGPRTQISRKISGADAILKIR